MGSTKAKRHIHKYHHVNTGMGKLWACAHPDCNHFMPKHYEAMLPGKATICWSCGEITELDSVNMKLDKPSCIECRAPGFTEQLLQEELSQIKIPESQFNQPEVNKLCTKCGIYDRVPGNPDGICYRCWLKTQ